MGSVRSIDGLSQSRIAREEALPATSPRRRVPKRAIASGLVVLGVLGLGVVLMRPSGQTSEASPSQESGLGSETSTDPTFHLRLPQGSGANLAPDDLVVLDQPTEASLPQSDTKSAPNTADQSTTEATPDFTIRILNGGSAAGSAAGLRDQLAEAGYEVLSIGNAKNTHGQTTLYHQADQRTAAETVAKQLGEPPIAFVTSAIASPADVLIVLGVDR